MRGMQFNLKPPRIFILLLCIIYMGAVICLLLVNLPWFIKVLLISACLVSFRQTHKNARRFTQISFYPKKGWLLRDNYGNLMWAQLTGDSLRLHGLIILNLRLSMRWLPTSIVLFSDTMPVDDFRRLRVCLINSIEPVRSVNSKENL